MSAPYRGTFLSLLLFLCKILIIRAYKIHGNVQNWKQVSLHVSKDRDKVIGDIVQDESLLQRKVHRYSFTPIKSNTINDVRRRLRFSNDKNVKLRKSKFFRKKDIHKSLIDDINKERLKEDIKSIGKNSMNENGSNQDILPLPLRDKTEECYNCLILCKGMPFHVNTSNIKNFFNPYKITDKYIIFIKDKNGNFFGDVIVRFVNRQQKMLALKNKNYKFLSHRYIQLFNINEEHYEEYFYIGYKNPPAYKNYVPIKNIVVPSGNAVVGSGSDEEDLSFLGTDNFSDDEDTSELKEKVNPNGILLKSIYTGKRLRGRITSVHAYGVFVDCDVYIKGVNNKFLKILALLHKNKLTINVGLPGDPIYEQENKELILQKNMNIIVYVDKIIKRKNDIYIPDESIEKNLIFFNLTLDSSITEEKIQWLQKMARKRKLIQDKIEAYNSKVFTNDPTQNEVGEASAVTMKGEGEKESQNYSPGVHSRRSAKGKNCHSSSGSSGSYAGSRSSKIFLMNNLTHECKHVHERHDKTTGMEETDRMNNNVEKEEALEDNNSFFYSENDNFDDIFHLDGDYEAEKEETTAEDGLEEEGEVNSIEDDGEETMNKKMKRKEANTYSDEMRNIMKNIFCDSYEKNDIPKGKIKKGEKIGRNDEKVKKGELLAISTKFHKDDISNGEDVNREERALGKIATMKMIDQKNDRTKWTSDVRKEESLFYSKMFGLNADINDFYSDDKAKVSSNAARELPGSSEEFAKSGQGKMGEDNLGEGKMGEDNLGEGKMGEDNLGEGKMGEDNLGEGKMGEDNLEKGKMGEDNLGEGKMGEDNLEKGKMGEDNLGTSVEIENWNEEDSPISTKIDRLYEESVSNIVNNSKEPLDFSHFSEMSLEELKKEIYKRKYILPIDISVDSLRNRLIQICICEKNNIEFDNYPFIRYYMFDFHMSVEDMKLIILTNREFLIKKNINKKLLDSLDINELKYLLHKSLENFRLWEPNDNVKIKIFHLNKDLLVKQDLIHLDNIGKRNLIILWNDFKDFMLNCIYGNTDDSYNTFDELQNVTNSNTTSNNVLISKYIGIMKMIKKENFFLSKGQSLNELLESQMKGGKDDGKNSFENSLKALNRHLEDNKVDLPDKINLKEAMKILNNRSYMKKVKRALNNDEEDRNGENYIHKIIQLILKHKAHFKEPLSEDILKKKPHEELIVMLDRLPADLLEELL
ncbi:conserved Plasmodium protein, unknown function [Plasmodium ovale]|uniref:RNA-binding protein n=1 Tax=Plasmodium ovale TaxID=36330 RepID=A0A1C3L5Y6_PLAOA|nr:conserved Plasmodium protein, unknown function [Plasmodium ovale]